MTKSAPTSLSQPANETSVRLNIIEKISRVRAARAGHILTAASLLLSSSPTWAVDYDLGSQEKTVAAPTSGVLHAGKTEIQVQAGDMITPAELAALNQIASGGHQTLRLAPTGAAVGGRVSLGVLGDATSLTIPSHVSVLGNFSKIESVTLTGDLVNNGNLYAFSTNPAVTAASLTANNITNVGNISTVLPTQLGLRNAIPSLDLNLIAVNNIVNSGTISSSGALNLYAGNSIINSMSSTALASIANQTSVAAVMNAANAAPLMQAVNNVNLTSIAGNIVNSGTISSLVANINVNAAHTSELLMSSTNGTWSATNGVINVRDSSFGNVANTSILGGDFLSKELNIWGGGGTINVDAGNITGVINSQGYAQHVIASSDVLTLGNICMTGDPTYYNTGSVNLGTIGLASTISVNQALTISSHS